MVLFLSVHVTYNTKKVISMFSGDRSRSVTLFQHCTRNEQCVTEMSVWASSTDHPPYFDMPCCLPWENWHGHLSLTYETFAQFQPNKISDVWNNLVNPMCHWQVCGSQERNFEAFIIYQNLHVLGPFRHSGLNNIAHVQSQHMWQTSTCTQMHQLPSKLRLMRLGLREYYPRTFTCLLLSFYISDHFAFIICVVLICYWFY